MGATTKGDYRISWPSADPFWGRWGSAAVIAVWLCGWAVGEVLALSALVGILLCQWPGVAGRLHLCCATVLSVGLWFGTFGGLHAMRPLYALARSKPREGVTLGIDVLSPEPGFMLPQSEPPNGQQTASWFTIPWRRPRVFRREQVAGSLRLDRVGERQRLTVDGVEIGIGLREPEREWLKEVLLAWAGGPDERLFSPSERFFRTS